MPNLELAELERSEAIIANGLQTFVDVGRELLNIKSKRLYRARGYAKWEDYCRERWGMSTQYAGRLSRAAEVVGHLKTETMVSVLPSTERATQPLTRIPEEDRARVWQMAVDAYGAEPTASQVQQVIDKLYETPPAPREELTRVEKVESMRDQPENFATGKNVSETPPASPAPTLTDNFEDTGTETLHEGSTSEDVAAPGAGQDRAGGERRDVAPKPVSPIDRRRPHPRPSAFASDGAEIADIISSLYSLKDSLCISCSLYMDAGLRGELDATVDRTAVLLRRIYRGLGKAQWVGHCPPSVEMVTDFALGAADPETLRTLGYKDAEDFAHHFIDYQESSGWLAGSKYMTDWQAALRTFLRYQQSFNAKANGQPKRRRGQAPTIAEVDADYHEARRILGLGDDAALA